MEASTVGGAWGCEHAAQPAATLRRSERAPELAGSVELPGACNRSSPARRRPRSPSPRPARYSPPPCLYVVHLRSTCTQPQVPPLPPDPPLPPPPLPAAGHSTPLRALPRPGPPGSHERLWHGWLCG